MAAALLIACIGQPLVGQEAQWIWSNEHPPGDVPQTVAFFRKSIRVPSVEKAVIEIAADDAYELFLNGRSIGRGASTQELDRYDITSSLSAGRNVIAVRVVNQAGPTAALVARVQVKPTSAQWRSYSTDGTWVTSLNPDRRWQGAYYNDSDWSGAQVIGLFGETAPWDVQPSESFAQTNGRPAIGNGSVNSANSFETDPSLENVAESHQRFSVQPGFAVQRVLGNDEVGSLIAMAFNEFGHLIASQEGGPLLLIYDSDNDGTADKVRPYSDIVKNVQGILPLNGDVLVSGDGPDGSGIYKLIDEDRDGSLEKSELLLAFEGTPGEHGVHQITLGPDGHVYIAVGNHALVSGDVAGSSPYRVWYEGDLLPRKFEDPGGHAQGIKAPGGTIVRLDLVTQKAELFAGGIRNAYDLAFHPDGSLFIHDSDMESDEGMTWYRPTNVFEVSAGAEIGWRSGWSKWPEYYVDRIPSLLSTGRGSPTGAVVYDHYQYPARYHKSLFLGDWSEGRIICATLEKNGASYRSNATTFLKGTPLNVTDLDVGPDGSIYFCTGGRGTNGSIYKVVWEGPKPDFLDNLGEGIAAVIRQPQMSSAWARQKVAVLKKEMGEEWNETIAGVAYSPDNSANYRVRALDLMQLLGPVPSADMLIDLSRSPNERVRARTAQLLGLQKYNEPIVERLAKLVSDSDPMVQRIACESLTRIGGVCEIHALRSLLASSDRHLSLAARNLLASIEPESWSDSLLKSKSPRIMVQASLALMASEPSKQHALDIADQIEQRMDGFISDRDFVDMLRVLQIAIEQGNLTRSDIPELSQRLVAEFPVGEPRLNRELIRLAVYFQDSSVIGPAVEYLSSDATLAERVNVAMHLSRLKTDWTSSQRFSILRFLESALAADSGSAYPLYLMQATNAIGSTMSVDEARIFVSEGQKWPNAALAGLYKFPANPTADDIRNLIALDRRIDKSGTEKNSYKRLKTGVTAVLAQSGQPSAMEYLREAWRRSPDRRATIALGLALQPDSENWSYLVRSIPLLELSTVPDIFGALTAVNRAPEDADAYRQAILVGLRMIESKKRPTAAIQLLNHWTGGTVSGDTVSGSKSMATMKPWQQWFEDTYPEALPALLPTQDEEDRWTLDELERYFTGDQIEDASPKSGLLVYSKAQCASCHRFNATGSAIGPDLTSVAKRFTRREFLESVLYPSHVISNQYQSKKFITIDGEVIAGMVISERNGTFKIRLANNEEIVLPEEDIDEIVLSNVSLMPTGLFNELSLEEIRDLMSAMGYVPDAQIAEKKQLPPIINR